MAQVEEAPRPPSAKVHVTGPASVVIPPLPAMGIAPILMPEEFENLKRSIQLLRISQLRYIVQRFALPASGNKTRLLAVVLQLVDAMRVAPILVQINAEVIALLSQQHEPFTNPLDSIQKLSVVSQTDFATPPHPLVRYADTPPVFGVIIADRGSSCGTFPFPGAAKSRCCLSFAWPDGQPHPMELRADLNGFPVAVPADDPRPTPLDITDLMIPNQINTITVKTIKTQAPVALAIKEYTIITAAAVIQEPDLHTVGVKGADCKHGNGMKLADFWAQAAALGGWNCPICGGVVSPETLVVIKTAH
jgi:hypothetical protein